MSILLGIIQFIIILYILFYEYKRRSASVFLWVMLFVIFAISHLATCLMGSNTFSVDALNEVSLYVILFCAIYHITILLFGRKESNVFNVDRIKLRDEALKYRKYITRFSNVLAVIMVLVVIIRLFLLITGSGGLQNISWATMRHMSSTDGVFSFSELFSVLYFVGSVALLLALLEKKYKKVIFLSLLVIIEVIISRNRIEILPLICTFLSLFIMKYKTLSLRLVIILAASLVIIIYTVYGLRVFRHYGTLSDFASDFSVTSFNDKVNQYIQTDNGELGLKNFFYYFAENKNNFENFGEGHTYKRMLLFMVPTSLSFGLKPPDFAISMGHAVDPTISGYSVHSTLFGDCYANFGFLGFVFMGIFWAIFVLLLDKLIIKTNSNYLKVSVFFVIAITYIIIGRGSVYNGFVWMAYSIITLYVISFLCRLRLKDETIPSQIEK